MSGPLLLGSVLVGHTQHEAPPAATPTAGGSSNNAQRAPPTSRNVSSAASRMGSASASSPRNLVRVFDDYAVLLAPAPPSVIRAHTAASKRETSNLPALRPPRRLCSARDTAHVRGEKSEWPLLRSAGVAEKHVATFESTKLDTFGVGVGPLTDASLTTSVDGVGESRVTVPTSAHSYHPFVRSLLESLGTTENVLDHAMTILKCAEQHGGWLTSPRGDIATAVPKETHGHNEREHGSGSTATRAALATPAGAVNRRLAAAPTGQREDGAALLDRYCELSLTREQHEALLRDVVADVSHTFATVTLPQAYAQFLATTTDNHEGLGQTGTGGSRSTSPRDNCHTLAPLPRHDARPESSVSTRIDQQRSRLSSASTAAVLTVPQMPVASTPDTPVQERHSATSTAAGHRSDVTGATEPRSPESARDEQMAAIRPLRSFGKQLVVADESGKSPTGADRAVRQENADEPADAVAGVLGPWESSSQLSVLRSKAQALRKEVDAAYRQLAQLKRRKRSISTAVQIHDADAAFSSGHTLDTRVQEHVRLSSRRESPSVVSLGKEDDTGGGDWHRDSFSDADARPSLTEDTLIPFSQQRQRASLRGNQQSIDKISRLVRFRLQATYLLRRKVRTLLEKKRPSSVLLERLVIDKDREILSLNAAAGMPAAAGQTQSPTAVPEGQQGVDNPSPLHDSTRESTASESEESNLRAPQLVVQPPFLDSLLAFEVPVSLDEKRDEVAAAYAQLNDLIAKTRKAQQRVQILSKGSHEEKRALMAELNVRLPDEVLTIRKPESSARRPSRPGIGARRMSKLKSNIPRRGSSKRLTPKKSKSSGSFELKPTPSLVVLCDTAVQTTLDDELLTIAYHRLNAGVQLNRAYQALWGTLYVALQNVVQLWDHVEVDISCARCRLLVSEAMIISPCGITVCSECLREDDEHTFDSHERPDCSCANHDGSIPNQLMRRFCKAYLVRDQTGAITPVPSESLLSELDYQLKLVAESVGILKSESFSVSPPPPTRKSSAPLMRRSTAVPSSTGGTGGILVKTDAAKDKLGAPLGDSSAKPRHRSVKIRIDDEDTNGPDDAKSLVGAGTEQRALVPIPSEGLTDLQRWLVKVGIFEYHHLLAPNRLPVYKKNISSFFSTQFRR